MLEITPTRCVIQCGWDSVPHLSEATKAELLASYPPHERDARTKGAPGLGSGAIYPLSMDEIVCDPFELPTFYPRCYGLDVGWSRTAAVWGAWNRQVSCLYIYTEHYRGQATPAEHAAAIKARGAWIPGVIDPASRGRGSSDGVQMLAQYKELGLDLTEAENAVEAGIFAVWNLLTSGRLKIFSSCQNLLKEYLLYRRDLNGRVVKENDHALDALRYLVMSGADRAITKPEPRITGSRIHERDKASGY